MFSRIKKKLETYIPHFYNNISIRYKFTLTNILVLFIPLLLVGTMFYQYSYRVIQDNNVNYKYYIVKLMSRQMNSFTRQLQLLTYSMYQSEIQDTLEKARSKHVYDASLTDKLFSYFFTNTNFLDIEGSLDTALFIQTDGTVYHSGYSAININYPFKETDWYRKAISSGGETEFYTQNMQPYLAVPKEQPCISVVRKINSVRENDTLGVLMIDIPYSKISNLFAPFELKADDNIYVVDDQGNIIFNNINPDLQRQAFDMPEYPSDNKASFGKRIYNRGIDRILVAYSTSDAGFKIISVDRMVDLLLILNQYRNKAVFYVIMFLLLGIIIAYFISFGLTKDISFLQKKMKSLQEGNFSDFIHWTKSDEIGMLAQSYNTMISKINELITQKYVIEIQERDAKFKALQAQINPHFLYNTLDSIGSIALVLHVPLIHEVTTKLSGIMRYCISDIQPIVKLREEFTYIETYLSILNIRYEDKFGVIWDIDPQTLDSLVLKLTIQPLVENAIYHGLEMKMGKGLLRICSKLTGDNIVIVISDDGPGIDKIKLASLQAKLDELKRNQPAEKKINPSSQIGLINVQERIILHFGNQYGLKIESDSSGTCITMTLPADSDLA